MGAMLVGDGHRESDVLLTASRMEEKEGGDAQ